jgi:RimJ/RimL family protein N-acetyltransferase
MTGRQTPPERIEVDGAAMPRLLLRRLLPDDAAAVARAATESIDHLRPFLPWAVPEKLTVEAQRRRLAAPEMAWLPEGDHFAYGVFPADDGDALLGASGLHRRRGPGAHEIGYWVHVAHLRRGIATAAASAMTDAGFAVQGIDTMEILCDVANHASAGIPRKLGYRLTDTIEHEAAAPAETGKRFVWTVSREEWCGAPDR